LKLARLRRLPVSGLALLRRLGPSSPAVSLLRRNRDFRLLFSASVISLMGDWFSQVAAAGLVTLLWGPVGGAVVFASSVLPIFVMSPLAGVLADRFDRRTIMVVSSFARVVPALLLVLANVTQQPWLAIVCMAVIAALAAFFEPVVSAVTPNMVEREDLSLAQTMMGSVWGTMLFVGAGLGGLVAALFGRNTSFIVDASTFILSAVLILRIRRTFRTGPVPASASVLAHLAEVWQFVRPRKVTRALMVTKTGVGVANGIVGLLPAFALLRFGSSEAGIGALLAARGIGALIGPIIGRRISREDGRRMIFVCGAAIMAYGIAYLFLPFTQSLLAACLCVALAHAGGGAQWVLSTYGLQATTPDFVRGRVMSLDFGLATLAIGVSSLLAGGAAELFGLQTTSFVLVVLAVAYGAGWLLWTRDLWSGADDPLHPGQSPPDGTATPTMPPSPM
jgi:MFS family permease